MRNKADRPSIFPPPFGRLLGSVFTAWIAPAILFVLVLVMGFIGFRWMGSQQVASVRAVSTV